MKIVFFIVVSFCLCSCFAQKMTTEIPANKTLELDVPEYQMYLVAIKNNSSNQINIKTIDKQTYKVKSGFGLNRYSKEKLTVKQEDKLSLFNNSDETINLTIEFEEFTHKERMLANQNKTINFTLINKSWSSIPLIIPKVMNPNLSPNSSSSVALAVGQEIYFKDNGRRYLLLTVDNSIKEGDELDVVALLKTRKKELNL